MGKRDSSLFFSKRTNMSSQISGLPDILEIVNSLQAQEKSALGIQIEVQEYVNQNYCLKGLRCSYRNKCNKKHPQKGKEGIWYVCPKINCNDEDCPSQHLRNFVLSAKSTSQTPVSLIIPSKPVNQALSVQKTSICIFFIMIFLIFCTILLLICKK